MELNLFFYIFQLWGDHGRAASSSAIAALGRAALIKNIVQDLNLRLMLYSIYRLRIFSEKKAQVSGHCLTGQQGVNTGKKKMKRSSRSRNFLLRLCMLTDLLEHNSSINPGSWMINWKQSSRMQAG